MPTATAMMFLTEPPSSHPMTSVFQYGRKYPVWQDRCSSRAPDSSEQATTDAAIWRWAISLARLGPETTATRWAGTPSVSMITSLIRFRVPSSIPLISETSRVWGGRNDAQSFRQARSVCAVTASTTMSAPSTAAAASVVACTDEPSARLLQRSCHTSYFRPYWNTDVIGCEPGGAVKNIIAVAAGIAEALGLGDNTKATLITRGLAEMARLGEVLGADPRTFAGLAGLGDLVATCSSPLSRNRTFGLYLGQGMNSAQAREVTKQTAEGATTYAPVLELARKHGVEMPITEVVAAVISGDLPAGDAAAVLASRSAKPEWYGA